MTNKKLLLPFSLFFILSLLLGVAIFMKYAGKENMPDGQTVEVILSEEGFTPADSSINSGDTVKFSSKLPEPYWPASDLHPTHGIYPEFDPLEPIEPDKSWEFKFTKKGTWRYHDHLNPYFRGTIIVQ